MKKRLLAFLAVVVLVMAMAVPASAAGFASPDDGISPHYVPMPCCGVMGTWQTRWDVVNWGGGRTISCRFDYSSCGGDYAAIKYGGSRCANCGHTEGRYIIYSGYYCPTAGNYKY